MTKNKARPKQPPVRQKKQQVGKPGWSSNTALWEIAGILLLVFFTYFNSISNDYNFDDNYVVSLDQNNTLTQKGISGIPEILKSKYNQGLGVTYGYRPLGKITMAIEYSLWGNNPHYSHFVNVLLFAINVWLLLIFFKRVARLLNIKANAIVYLGIVLFIVHPIHTEVVCSIKNREEILCFSIMLAALLFFMNYLEKRKWRYLLPFLFLVVLGFLAKETIVNIAGLMLLLMFLRFISLHEDWMLRIRNFFSITLREQLNRYLSWKRVLLIALFVLAFWVLKEIRGLMEIALILSILIGVVLNKSRSSIKQMSDRASSSNAVLMFVGSLLGAVLVMLFKYLHDTLLVGDIITHYEQNPYHFFSFGADFAVGIQTLFFYLKKLFIPFPLLFYYGYNMLPVKGWNTLLPYAGLIFLAGVLLFSLYSIYQRKGLFAFFSLGFFMIAIFPFSNFFPDFYVTGIVAERLAYQASAGFCMMFAWILVAAVERFKLDERLKIGEKLKWIYVLALALTLPLLIITLNRNADWKNKDVLFGHDIKYLRNSARANYIMASRIMNENDSYVNKQPDSEHLLQAKDYLLRAISIYPHYNDAWLNLGIVYLLYSSNPDSAFVCFSKVDTTDRFIYARSKEYQGDISYNINKDKEKAKGFYLEGNKYLPERPVLYQKASRLLFETGAYETVLHFADKGIQYDFVDAYMDKGDAYVLLGDSAAAVPYYQKSLEMGYNGPMLINLKEFEERHRTKYNNVIN